MADQLWLMTRIREEDSQLVPKVNSYQVNSYPSYIVPMVNSYPSHVVPKVNSYLMVLTKSNASVVLNWGFLQVVSYRIINIFVKHHRQSYRGIVDWKTHRNANTISGSKTKIF